MANKSISEEMKQNIQNYSSQIQTLDSFVDAVRQMPGAYIGGIGDRGFMNCIREIFQNAVDEMMRSYSPADTVFIQYDERNLSTLIMDNGRGIPHGDIIRVYTSEHTSSNYKKELYDYTSGTHGLGSKCTLALSSIFWVESYVLGEARRVEFYDGHPWKEGEKVIKCPKDRQGTTIYFEPARDIMETPEAKITLSCNDVLALIKSIYPLTNIGHKIQFKGIKLDGTEINYEFINQDGILTDIIMRTQQPVSKPIQFFDDNGTMKANIAFCYDSSELEFGEESINSFSNFCPTPSGGKHVEGFIDGLTRFFRDYMNKIFLGEKSKITVVAGDIKVGLKAIVNVAHLHPIFNSQSKELLTNTDMAPFVKELTMKSLDEWAKLNPNDLQKLCKYFKDVAELRQKQDGNKVKLSTKYQTSSLSGMPKKYAKPSGNKHLELIIVEGDSALGSAKNSRDSDRQGIFPIRGKIPNAFTTPPATFLSNQEVASILTILGGGYGKNFDSSKVKFEKVIFMADADADGSHIDSLLLRFALRYFKPLIEEGRVYRAVPPLYGIKQGGKKLYFTTRADFTQYIQGLFLKQYSISTLTRRKLTANECMKLFLTNIDYTYEITKASNTYAVAPLILEDILIMNTEEANFKNFKNAIKKKYRFMDVEQVNGTMVLKGLYDSKYHTVILDHKLYDGCKEVKNILDKNELKVYNLTNLSTGEEEWVTIYQLMCKFESFIPPSVTRFKGLGEQNPNDLADSALHPDMNRTLVRYTVEDMKKEIERIRFLESNKQVLLENINISRQDIE